MRDYYALFPALRMPRRAVLAHVLPVLREHKAELAETRCEQLSFDVKLQSHEWTGKAISHAGIDDALAQAENWQGLAFYFDYNIADVLGRFFLLMWNNHEPGMTTLALGESSTLFNLQRENAEVWGEFQDILLKMSASLDASFCTLHCNPRLQTIGDEVIADTLGQIALGRRVPTLLAIRSGKFPAAAALQRSDKARYLLHHERGYLIISDKQMGTPDRED